MPDSDDSGGAKRVWVEHGGVQQERNGICSVFYPTQGLQGHRVANVDVGFRINGGMGVWDLLERR